MRLFIAIDFEELKPYFKQIQEKIPLDLAKAKLTDSFHLTLKFLGDVQDPEKVKEELRRIVFDEFSLTLNNIGFFPNEKYIKVVWIGFKESEEIKNLQREIDTKLQKQFKKDNRFHPHITLARVRFVKNKESFVTKLKDIKIEDKEFTVTSFKIIKSTLTEKGPIYEDLETYKLNS